ncbi:MAG TPA: L,D-transpeptidase family protein [Aestuariivirgaceae bacterium]|jgi:murein L,D-transpeptidase YcbB/YkuD
MNDNTGRNCSLQPGKRLSRRAFLLLTAAMAVSFAADPASALFKRKEKTSAQSQNINKAKSKATTVTEVLQDEREAAPMFALLSPLHMQRAINRYERVAAQGDWPRVESSKALAKGGSGEEVVVLKQRLALEGYLLDEGSFDDEYDGITQRAVMRFQKNHGLEPTGKVGKQTAAALNVSARARLATLLANLPRVQEYSRDLADRYIIVNIPAAQLEAVSGGSVYSRHNIIAGKPDRPSPVVVTTISDLKFNPYWNAPASIVEKDIIPALLKDPDHLAKLNIRVFDGVGGPEIDPSMVDWANTPGDRYHFRQEPGEENAMASVKINFPSPFGVYMHDTPTKELFGAGERYFSSGCVRVEDVHTLINWILRGQDGWDMDRIKEVAASAERIDVEVHGGPQVRWVYLTGWVTDDGSVNFRPDIYGLDGTGFVIGQPLPVGQGVGSQRWVTEPLPYSYEDNGVASASDAAPDAQAIGQSKQSGPVQLIKKTNFNKQPQASASKALAEEGQVPTFGQQGAN